MHIRPLGTNIVFTVAPDASTTPSGLVHVVKLMNRDDWVRGCVTAVGPEVREVRVGDDVLVLRHSVYDVRRDGGHWVVAKEAEVLGVVTAGVARDRSLDVAWGLEERVSA